ncbi:MAG: hypothetical protein OIF50_04345 [Flavobacteriaceae bacterium]|nr:hypothetical protein [Flavobacteriaceae bacterium]
MKNMIVVAFLILGAHLANAQVFVEDTNINDEDINYIQLVGVNTSMFGVKIRVFVDYGQPAKFLKADKIRNKEGDPMKFNSVTHALNFMYKNGWKFVNYTETIVSGKLRYVYLLEKQ